MATSESNKPEYRLLCSADRWPLAAAEFFRARVAFGRHFSGLIRLTSPTHPNKIRKVACRREANEQRGKQIRAARISSRTNRMFAASMCGDHFLDRRRLGRRTEFPRTHTHPPPEKRRRNHKFSFKFFRSRAHFLTLWTFISRRARARPP